MGIAKGTWTLRTGRCESGVGGLLECRARQRGNESLARTVGTSRGCGGRPVVRLVFSCKDCCVKWRTLAGGLRRVSGWDCQIALRGCSQVKQVQLWGTGHRHGTAVSPLACSCLRRAWGCSALGRRFDAKLACTIATPPNLAAHQLLPATTAAYWSCPRRRASCLPCANRPAAHQSSRGVGISRRCSTRRQPASTRRGRGVPIRWQLLEALPKRSS